ncbi:C-type lectin domain family 4 member E-like [Clavelina lepadiformis]|uniref:C-type lectin domain family 4 member E-like n=1 Tax=Clavelina lepadiformis TaxID=159417 RepID=UPI004041596D
MRSLNTRRTIFNAIPRPSVSAYLILYIGMTDMVKEREWIWVDGELESNRNWSPGEGTNGDCAIIIWPREGFYDLGCNQNYRAICEKSIF